MGCLCILNWKGFGSTIGPGVESFRIPCCPVDSCSERSVPGGLASLPGLALVEPGGDLSSVTEGVSSGAGDGAEAFASPLGS